MLKGIPHIIPPELLKILCEMGHGDRIVIADANFPAQSMGKDAIVLRMDGHGIPEILRAVLQLIPLDQYIDQPVILMDKVDGDQADVSIWNTYDKIVEEYESRGKELITKIERFEFYNEARTAYAIIATGESSQYANIILQKGCIIK